MDLTDKIPMPAAYLSTQATGDDDPTVEAVLRRTYEWAYRACQAAEEAAALARAQAK